MGFRKKDAKSSDNRSKAKVIMGKPASQLTKEEKKILSARMAEIRKENGGKNTVQNTIPFLCMYKDGVCRVSENFFSLTVQFYDANYSISEFEEQNNIFSKYCDVINLFDNTIRFQLTFENQNRTKEKLIQTVQIPEQEDDFNTLRKEYSQISRAFCSLSFSHSAVSVLIRSFSLSIFSSSLEIFFAISAISSPPFISDFGIIPDDIIIARNASLCLLAVRMNFGVPDEFYVRQIVMGNLIIITKSHSSKRSDERLSD